jgi:hypothetical protein
LLDPGFFLIGRDHTWRRDDFAATFSLQSRQFEVDQVVRLQNSKCEAAGRI